VKKEKAAAAPAPETVRVRPAGGVGVSELRNKLGSMMKNPVPHGPPGPGMSLIQHQSCSLVYLCYYFF